MHSDSGQFTTLKYHKTHKPTSAPVAVTTHSHQPFDWLCINQGSPSPLIHPYLQGIPER